MPGLPIYSAGRRFLQRLGISLLHATLFGSILGLLVYSRVPRGPLEAAEDSRTLLASPSAWLEDWERVTFDWRARELGARATRSERVVVVALDDETLAESRQDGRPELAVSPWARELLGGLVHRLVDEGAELVLLDVPLTERSPRTCLAPGASGAAGPDDDRALRALLDRHPERSVLAFSWSFDRSLPPSSRLWPYRVYLGTYENVDAVHARAQAVLADQRPAFLIPAGSSTEIWAGVASEQEGLRVGAELGAGGTPRVQERRAADDAYRVSALELLVSMAEVEVAGLDPALLPEVRQLQHPIAPLLGTASLYGAVTLTPDPDGVVRAIPHLVSYRSREGKRHVLPSMPLAAAMKLAGTRQLRYAGGLLHVGDRFAVPMDESGYSLVRWDAANLGRGTRGSVARFLPAWNVLLNLLAVREGVPPRVANDLQGRAVVFTSATSQSLSFAPTPIGGRTPEGAILAQSLVNLLESEGITRTTPRTDLLLTFGLALLGAFLALTFSRGFHSFGGALVYFLSVGMAAVAYGWGAWYVFVTQQLWVAMAGPLLAMGLTFLLTTVHAFRTEQQLRHFVTDVLGRYVSPEVARLVSRDLTLMRPERRQVTAFICDVAGFTHLAEQLPPEQFVPLINEYLTEMTAVVRSSGGQVDKYLGAAVMAFWGAPVRTEHHAHLACEAALKMRAVLLQRQAAWEKAHGHRLALRVGIDSGEVLVGDIGSNLESHYTVLGDAVKLALQLKSANPTYGTAILVGHTTAQLAQDAFVFREVDRIRVKGRAEPLRVHELLGRQGEVPPRMLELLTVYEPALTAYHQRGFREALLLFERCRREFGDPVAEVYLERCRSYASAAPPTDWDGVFVLAGRK